MLSFVFSFTPITVLKILSNMFFFYVHDIKVITKETGLSIKKTPRKYFTLLNWRSNQTKSRNFCLLDWKSNTISPSSSTMSYNFSLERSGGTTSLSTLPTKKSFLFFLNLWSAVLSELMIRWQEPWVKKRRRQFTTIY